MNEKFFTKEKSTDFICKIGGNLFYNSINI
jgi:hypothetical protein